jgi:hypothetical protein
MGNADVGEMPHMNCEDRGCGRAGSRMGRARRSGRPCAAGAVPDRILGEPGHPRARGCSLCLLSHRTHLTHPCCRYRLRVATTALPGATVGLPGDATSRDYHSWPPAGPTMAAASATDLRTIDLSGRHMVCLCARPLALRDVGGSVCSYRSRSLSGRRRSPAAVGTDGRPVAGQRSYETCGNRRVQRPDYCHAYVRDDAGAFDTDGRGGLQLRVAARLASIHRNRRRGMGGSSRRRRPS